MDMNATDTAPDDTWQSEGEAPNAGSNQAPLDHLITSIKLNLAKANSTGLEALTNFRNIGDSLLEAKEILPKGEFGPWAEAQFSFSKEWRARLMKLATNWRIMLDAFDWARKLGRVLGRKEYGVDGALALLREYETANDPEAQAKAAAAQAEREAKAQAKAEAGERKETEAEELRRLLSEAMARINALEAALNKARKGSDEAPNDAPKGDSAATVSAADKGKARKVHGLYKRGGTQGETDAARNRLQALADKNGMAFEDFLAACGLEA